MKKEFYIYVYLDPRKPGKYGYGFKYEPFYIGLGSNPSRKFVHLEPRNLKKKHPKSAKIKKIRSEGLEPIIEVYKGGLSRKEANKLETILINKIGRKILNEGPLTNLKEGGQSNKGYKHTAKAKKRIGKVSIGRYWSEEQKDKLRKKRTGKNNPMYNKEFSEEHLNNLSKAQKKRYNEMRLDKNKLRKHKEIHRNKGLKRREKCILISPTGIKYYVIGITEFCKKHDLSNTYISQVINGHKKSYKGWRGWKQ